MDKKSKILVTGAGGLLGFAICKKLEEEGFCNIYTPSKIELDCLNVDNVEQWFQINRPDYVFHLASLVFGLKGNLDNQLLSLNVNTRIAENVLYACSKYGIKKVFYAGTVASYPYPYPSLPLKEEEFWNGKPHSGEYGYAVAKRYALSLLELLHNSGHMDYCYGLFTNLYGPNDRFNTENGHVIPSLIFKVKDALDKQKEHISIWGNPEVSRDFLYSFDAADAAILAMKNATGIINISSAQSTSMKELIHTIIEVFGKQLQPIWDANQPVGIKERVVDNSKISSLGFKPAHSLCTGIAQTVEWLNNNLEKIRK